MLIFKNLTSNSSSTSNKPLAHSYHVPEVKIISHEPVKPGAKTALLLKLTNPTGHEMQLRLLRPEDIPPQEDKEEPKSIEKSLERSLNLEKV